MLTRLKKKALDLYVGNGIIKLLVNYQRGTEIAQNQKDRFGSQIKIKKDLYRGENQLNGG